MWLPSSCLSPRPAVNVASAHQIGLSRRRRYPSKHEEGRDTTQGTALCCFVDLSECRADCDMGKKKKRLCVGVGERV